MLIFPNSIKDDADRPTIIFKSISSTTRNDTHIVLPIPQSLQFSDSAAYNNSELGFGGAMVLNAARSDSTAGAIQGSLTAAVAAVPKDLKTLAGFAGTKLLSGELRSAVGVATGTTLNKNIVTEFTGVATRQYSYAFKLISGSAQESKTVKDIVNTLRTGLYPEGSALQLTYPPTWNINFMKSGLDIEYLPNIFECYLTTMSASYNSSMNLFHDDGSPAECDIQMTFMETRALTLDDIKRLEESPFKPSNSALNQPFGDSAASNVADAINAR